MKHTFTPGPWHVGMKPGPMIYGPNGEGIADMSFPMVASGEHKANARLIAAAPEQHDLLIEALDLVPRMSDDDPIAPALAEWCRKARTVIAKATGE